MGRTYAEWEATQDKALVAKVRAGDEANKPLLNQVNWIWVKNLMDQKSRSKSNLSRVIGLGNLWSNRSNAKINVKFTYSFCFLFSASYA